MEWTYFPLIIYLTFRRWRCLFSMFSSVLLPRQTAEFLFTPLMLPASICKTHYCAPQHFMCGYKKQIYKRSQNLESIKSAAQFIYMETSVIITQKLNYLPVFLGDDSSFLCIGSSTSVCPSSSSQLILYFCLTRWVLVVEDVVTDVEG